MAAASAVALLAVACSSGGSTSPRVSRSPAESQSSAPTQTPAGPPQVVWVVRSGAVKVVRVLSPSGGSPRTLVSVPLDATVAGVGGGQIAFLYGDRSLHLYSLGSGGSVAFPTGIATGEDIFGGALSPDGRRFAFAVVRSATAGSLRLLDIATGVSTTLRTYSSATVDAPTEWVDTRILAETVVGFSDAGPQAAVAIDPSSGAETASTSIAGAAGTAFSPDGMHVFDTTHSPLGDDADSAGGPGPQQPFNTLREFTIGSTPSTLYSAAHHQLSVFAVSDDGSSAVYYNDSSAGGFAGISLSPQFGLFLIHGTTPLQLTHYGEGGRWDAGAFVDAASAAMARHVGSAEQLVLVGPSHSTPVVLDTVAGGDAPAFVSYSPTS